MLWLLLCPAISMLPLPPVLPLMAPAFSLARASWSGPCDKPLTGISRQMLAPREGWVAGRPEAALTSWVIDLGEWSGVQRWQTSPVSPLAEPDGSRSASLMCLSQGRPYLSWAPLIESRTAMASLIEARREPQTRLEGLEPHPGPWHHFLLSSVPIGDLGIWASSPAVSERGKAEQGKRRSWESRVQIVALDLPLV